MYQSNLSGLFGNKTIRPYTTGLDHHKVNLNTDDRNGFCNNCRLLILMTFIMNSTDNKKSNKNIIILKLILCFGS